MYAASGNRGAVDTPAANRGSLASVTGVNSSGDALTAVASTLLNACQSIMEHVPVPTGRRVGRSPSSLRLSGSAILLQHLTTS